MTQRNGMIVPIVMMVLAVAAVGAMAWLSWDTNTKTANTNTTNTTNTVRNTNGSNLNTATSNTNSSVTANTNTATNSSTTNANTNSSATASDTLPAGWSRFINTKYNYRFDHPTNREVYSSEYAVDDEAKSSNISILGENSGGHPSLYVNVYTTQTSVQAYASAERVRNANDTNPNSPNKKVGALEKVTLNGRTGYSFTVTDSFKTAGGGYTLKFPYRFTYVSGTSGQIIEVGYATDQATFVDIYKTFTTPLPTK